MVALTFRRMIHVFPLLLVVPLGLSMGEEGSVTHAADPVATNEVESSSSPLVVGRVMYRGPVPAPIEVQVDRDNEVCGQVMTLIPLAVDVATHGVRDAVVHVGAVQETVNTSSVPVSIVQNKQCKFYPRVATARVGAQTELKNEDPVMHNTNVGLNNATVLNVALVPGGTPVRKPLKKEGLHIVKCNVHKFMQAYRYVFSDSFFDQTTDDGQFRIQGLSPGPHTISAWHETLGVLHKEIHVPVRGTVHVDFEFK